MLVGEPLVACAAGRRWFETLPHESRRTGWRARRAASVTALSRPMPDGARADEVLVTLAGGHTIASFHFSARCTENRRSPMIQGTKGRISVDLLSDFATISTQTDSKLRRVVSRTVVDAGNTLLRAAPDRGRYGVQKLRKASPHLKIIRALGRSLRDNTEDPTPLEEVDYVIRKANRSRDRSLAERARAR
jgi:hypothetical protein